MNYNKLLNTNKAIFLDRDGVINIERGDYTWKEEDFVINDGIIDSLFEFNKYGFLLIIISNQGGIAKELYNKNDVNKLHNFLNQELNKNQIILTDIYYCPHHPKIENCICRKPDSLMFEKAIAKYNINPSMSFMFGDKTRDIEAAEKAGINGILIEPNQNISSFCKKIIAQIN